MWDWLHEIVDQRVKVGKVTSGEEWIGKSVRGGMELEVKYDLKYLEAIWRLVG